MLDIHRLGALNANTELFEDWAGVDFDSNRLTSNENIEVEDLDNTVSKRSNDLVALELTKEGPEEDLYALEECDHY